jgi:hypothetical protein
MRKESLPGWRAIDVVDKAHTALAFTVLAILVVVAIIFGLLALLVNLVF